MKELVKYKRLLSQERFLSKRKIENIEITKASGF